MDSTQPNFADPSTLVMAIPKGRVGKELSPWFALMGLQPEDDFFNSESRKLLFRTNDNDVFLIRVRSFDVVTHVAFGGASLGIVGSDVIEEFRSPDLFAPVDLGIGQCRLSLAELVQPVKNGMVDGLNAVRVASKYPNLTKAHFLAQGMQCECVKLNGAIELAPKLGVCPRIIDLVSSGETLKANGLNEVEVLMQVSSHLVVNRARFKTASKLHQKWIEKFREVADDKKA